MKRRNLITDTQGNSYLWVAFSILILTVLTVVIYNIIFVYTTINTAKHDLERVSIITVNETLINANVRDLNHTIPEISATQHFFDNLSNLGYQQISGAYVKKENDKELYRISNIKLSFNGELMEIKADLTITLLWEIDSVSEIVIPIKTLSRVYYFEE